MLRVGLTGVMGSGKSVVRETWERLGAFCVDADRLAKHLMQEDETLKDRLVQAFGPETYLTDGSLNREFLSRQAFVLGRVDELNAIVHPRVIEETRRLFDEAEKRGADVSVKEAALLLAKGRPTDLDLIVVVSAPPDVRIQWITKRDNVDRSTAVSRIHAQPDEQEMLSHADIVIQNEGDLEALRIKAQDVYTRLTELEQ